MSEEQISLAPEQAIYKALPKNEAMEMLHPHCFQPFFGLSLGNADRQVAIIPLDEASLEDAQKLVRGWNYLYPALHLLELVMLAINSQGSVPLSIEQKVVKLLKEAKQ